MTVLSIAGNSLRRLVRVRANLFFVFALPLMLIVVLGLTVGNDEPRIGVLVLGEDSPAKQQLIDDLERLDGSSVVRFDGRSTAIEQLLREDITALVVLDDGLDDALAAGTPTELEYQVIPSSGGFEMQSLVESVVADRNAVVRATQVVGREAGVPPATAAEQVASAAEAADPLTVVTVDADGEAFVDSDAVGFVAAQELVLFVFLMGMVAASALIQERRLGVTRRMLATRATPVQVIAGHALGRYAIAAVQAAFIVGATALLFGLDWGSWTATAAIVAAFCLVGTAVALLVGALVSNESQSLAVGISLGLSLAALGGCMVPFEIFPDWLRTAAHVTPHAWAIDAFTDVINRGGSLGQIAVPLAVLMAFGVALLAAATAVLRRAIVA